MIALRCRGRRATPFAALCTLCVAAGMAPTAWVEMSARDFLRALQRRVGS